jgi:purine-binding chemotaxis protein CheW
MSVESIGKYLTFMLGEQGFAVDVAKVEVVLESMPITRVPKAPPHLRGVINYRGSVIPVADIRTRFGEGAGRSAQGASQGTSIIVLQLKYGQDDITIGMLADAVREVIDIEMEKIEKPPEIGSRVDEAIVAGIARKGDEFIVLLDIDEAFKAEAPAGERVAESR